MLPSRANILLTGSTGVIGRHLLSALAARHDVTALAHRRRPHAATSVIQGDITADNLGMATPQRRELAARIDVIVHSAGLTDFAPPDLAAYDRTNAEGTRRILELAETARVPVVLLSSAAAAINVDGDDLAARSIRAYGDSKRRAEHFAAHSTQPVATVRPALLFAAHKGPTPHHQFPHALIHAVLQGRLTALPVNPDHWCDTLPMETLVDYVTQLTEAQLRGDTNAAGLHWTTAGPARLTAADLAQACTDYLEEAGRTPNEPLLAPHALDRPRSHGMARLAQLGFLPPHHPDFPTHLTRLLPTQPSRKEALDALTHTIRRCATTTPQL